MYTIDNTIKRTSHNGLQATKLLDINASEILSICLEKATTFPVHTSPTEAHLFMVEGEVSFFINNEKYILSQHQFFKFPKDEAHWVEANENSKFLIIR